ncbi:unnamed protein product [Gongylonema pulchrum]|uniref:Uncharacterized protein n=1 Tax=Gongylonema pulchrum TaxID=637853 RepID=A0A183DI87_9BILA|nr:unnamed protein product [Gongylonema pulchrum]
MLDVASYLLVDPLLTLLSDVIVSKVNADTLVLAYHRAGGNTEVIARQTFEYRQKCRKVDGTEMDRGLKSSIRCLYGEQSERSNVSETEDSEGR